MADSHQYLYILTVGYLILEGYYDIHNLILTDLKYLDPPYPIDFPNSKNKKIYKYLPSTSRGREAGLLRPNSLIPL